MCFTLWDFLPRLSNGLVFVSLPLSFLLGSGITYSEAEAYGKLLHLRELVRPHIRHSIGDGQHSMLWFDYWLPSGPILSTINEQVIDDSRLGRNCLVSLIVDGTRWRWPSTNTIHLMAARDLMPVDLSPDPSRRDTIQWAVQVMRGKKKLSYSSKERSCLSPFRFTTFGLKGMLVGITTQLGMLFSCLS
jgi:hypothetical protein